MRYCLFRCLEVSAYAREDGVCAVFPTLFISRFDQCEDMSKIDNSKVSKVFECSFNLLICVE